MAQSTDIIDFRGGLDIVSPYLRTGTGSVISCQNYEAEARGYRRVEGYERFDGQPKPSEASYSALSFDAGTDDPTIGAYIRGGTSGAVGIILAVSVTSGSWVGNDAAGTIAIGNIEGAFQDNETLEFVNDGFDSGFSSGFGNG